MSQARKKGELLKNGQTLFTSSGKLCTVKSLIGSGGQGEVYLADFAGKEHALKFYFSEFATPDQKRIITDLISKGSPDPRFLWPIELVDDFRVKGFGYLMALRPADYRSINDMMKRRADPTFYALCTATMQLAHSFLQLHSKGLSYRDISFGNVFIQPDTGDILICDNDNVGVDGQQYSTVIGTPSFMAPEVILAQSPPNADSDRFSLAILLFYMLMLHHPLDGAKELQIKCKDSPAMRQLYGEEPVFIFDPADLSNRPVHGEQENAWIFWDIYPEFIRRLFTQTFTEGIRDPNARVRESEWRKAFIQLRNSIAYCVCGAENFYDHERLKYGGYGCCWSCKRELARIPRIRLGKSERTSVMLDRNLKLYPHHTDDTRPFDFSSPTAQISQHPANPAVWGLKNSSDKAWHTTTKAGVSNTVEPGRSVTITEGLVIDFGNITGEILL